MDPQQLGDRIREAREALNLGQETLAQQVGVPRTALSAIENGKREVSAGELLQFSEALGRPLDYFLRSSAMTPFDFQPLLRMTGFANGTAPEGPQRGRPPKGDGRSEVRRFSGPFRRALQDVPRARGNAGAPPGSPATIPVRARAIHVSRGGASGGVDAHSPWPWADTSRKPTSRVTRREAGHQDVRPPGEHQAVGGVHLP